MSGGDRSPKLPAPGSVVPHHLVDLTQPLTTGTPVYPGDPEVTLRPAATRATDGTNLLHVTMGSQSGTHVDAPFHLLDAGARVDEIALDRFLGRGIVIDLRHRGPRTPITIDDLSEVRPRLQPGLIVLLHTGWSRHWGSDHYLDHPYLDAGAAELLVEAGIRTVGIDAASVDETVEGPEHPTGLAAHQVLLSCGGVIVENLTNLHRIGVPDPMISVLPLRIVGGDGAPVRAVAFSPIG